MDALTIIEDDNSMYERITSCIPKIEIPIMRAINRVEALKLSKQYGVQAFWIVDGIFPRYPDSRSVDVLWPGFVRHLQYSQEDEKLHIVWLTSDVSIFTGLNIPVFPKDYLEDSMEKISSLIQQAHNAIR